MNGSTAALVFAGLLLTAVGLLVASLPLTTLGLGSLLGAGMLQAVDARIVP